MSSNIVRLRRFSGYERLTRALQGYGIAVETFLDYPSDPRVHFKPIMRRTPHYFACAGLELARYFALVYAAGSFAAATPSAPQVLRIVAAPNALFAVAFLFLGIDAERYAAYRPLLAVGKAVALFSGIIALPRLLGLGGDTSSTASITYTVVGVAVWDAAASALLVFPRKTRAVTPAPAATEPERVELD